MDSTCVRHPTMGYGLFIEWMLAVKIHKQPRVL